MFLVRNNRQAQPTPNPTLSPSSTPAVFSPQTLAELKRLQQAALTSDYAYRQVAHLSNNIGPRLTGSAQAAKAVEYVAERIEGHRLRSTARKSDGAALGARRRNSSARSISRTSANTTQKIVLCALGASVATPPDGIEAEVIVVRNFDELKSLPRDKVAGKIVLFNYPFDKQMAAEGRGDEAYGEAVVYRSNGPVRLRDKARSPV